MLGGGSYFVKHDVHCGGHLVSFVRGNEPMPPQKIGLIITFREGDKKPNITKIIDYFTKI